MRTLHGDKKLMIINYRKIKLVHKEINQMTIRAIEVKGRAKIAGDILQTRREFQFFDLHRLVSRCPPRFRLFHHQKLQKDPSTDAGFPWHSYEELL